MLEKIIIELFNKKCIKFGQFTLKNGNHSNIYIDLKNIISYPFLLNLILDELYSKLKLLEFNRLLGIPYGGIILSSSLCSKYNLPMIMLRKEYKTHGLKKYIEGEYNESETCLIIEDTITTGSSALKFINMIKKYKLNVTDILVICDRRTKIDFEDINVHSLFNIKDIIEILYKYNHITSSIYNSINATISKVSYKTYFPDYNNINLKNILKFVKHKSNNYCFDLKFNSFQDLLQFIDFYNDELCLIKIYSDLIKNFDYKILKQLSEKYNFLIMEGKNFHCLESNFINEYSYNKHYEWCHLIELSNLHSPKIFNILNEFNSNTQRPVSVIYNNYNNDSKLLYILNKNKNIIGLNASYLECDILIFDTLKSNNLKANIIILEPNHYINNLISNSNLNSNNFIPIDKIL